jgi:small subunit ribosomal protein S15
MLTQEKKSEIIKKHQLNRKDTGSPEVQVALLTEEIKELLEHLKRHPKDIHSRRGLLKKVTDRKKWLKYLKKESEERYTSLIKELGLKG